MCIRRSRPGDAERLAFMLHSLSSQSIRQRFSGFATRDEAAGEFRREVAHTCEGALTTVAEHPDGWIVAIAHAMFTADDHAELAFVVSDPYQCHGLGSRFLAEMLPALRRCGIRTAHTDALPQNTAMQRLLQRAGVPYKATRGEDGVYVEFNV
jgi:RimJ/RimL family protein N-acetyltransferase